MTDLLTIIGLVSAGFGLGVIFMCVLFYARDDGCEDWIDEVDEHERMVE